MPVCRVLLVLLLTAAPLAAVPDVWTPGGPEAATVRALAVHPEDPEILWVGTDGGGIYKSGDGGASWAPVHRGLTDFDIRALVVAPSDPDTLYAAAGDLPFAGGIFRSTDGGLSWKPVNRRLPGPRHPCDCGLRVPAFSLAVDPRDPAVVYAGLQDWGTFKSRSAGESWSASNLGNGHATIQALVIDPARPSTLLAGADDGVYRSTDGGALWSLVTRPFGSWPVRALAFDPADSRTAWAGGPRGILRSTDGGRTWRERKIGPAGARVLSLAAARPGTGRTVLWAGTDIGVFRSLDGGNRWVRANAGIGNLPVAALTVDPLDAEHLWAGTSFAGRQGPGVFQTHNEGTSWQVSNRGLTAARATGLVRDSGNTLWISTEGLGVFRSVDGGVTWEARNQGLRDRIVRVLLFDAPRGLFYAATPSGLFRSEGGESWTLASGALRDIQALLATPEGVLFAGMPNGIWRSDNRGMMWTATSFPAFDVTVLSFDPQHPESLWAGTRDRGLFRSRDGGATWEAVPLDLGEPDPGHELEPISAIAWDPSHPGLVYAAAGGTGRVWVSLDGGETWDVRRTELSGGEGIRALGVHPADSSLWAGSEDGIIKSFWKPEVHNLGFLWFPFTTGAGNARVTAFAFDPLSEDRAWAATLGGGVYRGQRQPCRADAETLCLQSDRFEVTVRWTDFSGNSGPGRPLRLSEEDGVFWYFDPESPELAVKVADLRTGTAAFVVNFASLGNLGFALTVTDTVTTVTRTWFNAPGSLVSREDFQTFFGYGEPLGAAPPSRQASATQACATDLVSLCLAGRFRVRVGFTDFEGQPDVGHPVPVTTLSGAFDLHELPGLDLYVKMIDGRAENGHFWFFFGALTNVPYTIQVTDMVTGQEKSYTHPPGEFTAGMDAEAF